ncbi:MAG: hypothetical protein FJX78_04410, partial [Armatimonadetes bacterium]|nr:hypothetical protein [Armatimonadota bacterium]
AVNYNMSVAEVLNLYSKDGLDPWLLESWSATPQGVFTWKVRRGVKFSDGTPLTAEAVKNSIEFLRDPRNEYPYRSYFVGKTDGIDVVDESTLRVRNRTFDVEFMDRMPNVGILAPASLRPGVDLRRQAIGSGAYKLQTYTPGERIVMTRNDAYWRPNEPYLDRIVFRAIPDESVRLLELEAGTAHLAIDMGAADLRRAQQRGLRVYPQAPVGSMLFYFNLQKIRERAVREAVQYAIDREAIVKALYSTHGDSVSYNIPRAMKFFHDTSVPTYGFDPDRARRILEEAGYRAGGDGIRQNASGQRLVWEMPSSSIASTIAASQMIAGMLRRVGIQANIRIMDFRTYEANAINGNYDVAYYEWAGSSADNPWHNTLVTYSQYAWKIPQINDPVLDRLHIANLTTLDRDARKRVLREYFTNVQRNAYYVTIGHKPYVFVARPEVEGVGFYGNRLMFNGTWLNR